MNAEILALAASKRWPAVSLGKRDIRNRAVGVGVSQGRFAWEQAVRHWPIADLADLLAALKETPL